MRILFDGYWWIHGPVSNQEVMREFILAWERLFPDDELVVTIPRGDVALARTTLPARIRIVGVRLRPQGVSAILEVPFIARRLRVDRIVTHNFTPLFGRSAVFVHDFMFVNHPEWFTRAERAYYSAMPMTLGRARWVLTSSRTEAQRINALARRHPTVVPVGLALSRGLENATARRPKTIDGIDDFLLAVGRINIRKNLGTAIRAAVASGVATPATPMIIVGEPEGRTADIGEEAANAIDSGAVRFLGFISVDELAWLYSHARVFVFLSVDEGFGMPTLEAAHFGAPIVASDIPVFREILGDRARFVDPGDAQAAAAAITDAWETGRTVPVDVTALGYSWEASAQKFRETIL
jgi:glycosyltransferase involved in cell wall biosynthesis